MGIVQFAGGKRGMKAPTPPGLLLSTIAEGSLVKLTENGTPVEYYVAKHNYEEALNGAGRVLMVRRYTYDTRQWHTSNVNAYATSAIDAWMNGEYLALFDAATQAATGTTTFYYTPGNGNNTVTTLSRKVFALSVTELGKSAGYANTEGSALPIASSLQTAYNSAGTAQVQWTRSPNTRLTSDTYGLDTNGNANTQLSGATCASRPCFTLPSNALFDPDTLIFKGVA